MRRPRPWSVWMGMLAAVGGLLAGALAPPFLSPQWRAVVMHVFSPVCHQLSARSPFWGEIQIAICDRCAGIYVGLVVGVATIGLARLAWARVETQRQYVLLGSLVPLGVDWIGPVVGLWTNTPLSRAATGILFGVIVGSFVADRVLTAAKRGQSAS